jgi:hypothetical protein
MQRCFWIVLVVLCLFALGVTAQAGDQKVLTNHLGYEASGPKHFVILGKASDTFSNCTLKDWLSDSAFLVIPARAEGAVSKWRDWYFWTGDFDAFASEGRYYGLPVNLDLYTRPFLIQQNLLGATHCRMWFIAKGQQRAL